MDPPGRRLVARHTICSTRHWDDQVRRSTEGGQMASDNLMGRISAPAAPRPPLWARMSVVTGNMVQLAGLVLGAALLYLAAHSAVASGVRIALMILGWFAIYVCC